MKLPPLNPLRAFEAAARHESFLAAANELNVTPGAISRQVKTLEEYLGFPLFVRVHNGIEVSAEAKPYQEAMRAAFLLMEQSTKQLLSERSQSPLNVWCSRLFMRQWLVPRLADFQDMYPGQEVRLTGGRSDEPLPIETDLAIRFGTGPFEPWQSHFLMGTSIIPVCSPEYLKQHGPIERPADLLGHTLLFTTTRLDDWYHWLSSAGVENVVFGKKLTLQGDGLAYRAAIESAGVAIGRKEFLQPDVAAGRLVTPIDHSVRLKGDFYLIYPRAPRHTRQFNQFRDWLLNDAKETWDQHVCADSNGTAVASP
ncbi:LysR substrate-binding domain-containing protein [Ensifer sp. YR511]|uniref:LysR substrate-binding domain-containing protein n=1 Tax=Ensifer sp. YR511 TaxID=1855294 RepID=UPI000885817A|nr:LysR substrate-binding domain-containing protein [Ensifer sp. YR511]SDN72942.1 LysR family transcriptional regulator, glycine cleavage system transcriptional activator [Ensifer sp. YR511]